MFRMNATISTFEFAKGTTSGVLCTTADRYVLSKRSGVRQGGYGGGRVESIPDMSVTAYWQPASPKMWSLSSESAMHLSVENQNSRGEETWTEKSSLLHFLQVRFHYTIQNVLQIASNPFKVLDQ